MTSVQGGNAHETNAHRESGRSDRPDSRNLTVPARSQGLRRGLHPQRPRSRPTETTPLIPEEPGVSANANIGDFEIEVGQTGRTRYHKVSVGPTLPRGGASVGVGIQAKAPKNGVDLELSVDTPLGSFNLSPKGRTTIKPGANTGSNVGLKLS